MINHCIKMICKSTVDSATYDNVVGFEMRSGVWIVLKLSSGETATFDAADWEMYDLTPVKGWNSNI